MRQRNCEENEGELREEKKRKKGNQEKRRRIRRHDEQQGIIWRTGFVSLERQGVKVSPKSPRTF